MLHLRKRLFAWGLSHGYGRRYERFLEPHKQRLLGDLAGTVLEIGPGTGANLRFIPPGVRWIGVEPNPYMHRYLLAEARRVGRQIEICQAAAEALPLPDASVDAVISTLVICSLTDPWRAMGEVRRVLRPGGRLVFIEHVAAPPGTPLRYVQEAVRPAWQWCGDNCHTNRETPALLAAAGFAELNIQRLRAPLPVVSPHIVGWAVK